MVLQGARKPVPRNYVPSNFQDLGAAAPAMGNHLLDPTTHEFHGTPFTRHWIYGVYDGRVIFYEEMLARSYILSKPDACFPIQSPDAVALTGYYPTRSCVRYTPRKDEYTVSMEDFVLRQASPTRAGSGGSERQAVAQVSFRHSRRHCAPVGGWSGPPAGGVMPPRLGGQISDQPPATRFSAR
jgi:hypothetical protein